MRQTITLLAAIFLVLTLQAQTAGEIVFSDSPIAPDVPAGLKTEFTAGEHIYAVAFLTDAVKNLYQNQSPNATLQVEVFIYEKKPPLYSYQQPGEEQLTFANMWVTGTVKDNKYLVVDLVPDPSKTSAYGGKEIIYKKFGSKYEGPVNFAETLGKLAPGKHELKVAVHCYYAPVATGELTLTGDNFSPYTTLAEKLNNAAASAGAASAEFPKAVATDPARVTRMIAALKNSNDWKNGRFDATEILKTVITYDWEIRRHEISGAILHRYCIAAVAVKTKSGECAYYKVTFQEDYAGGNFQPLRYDGAGDKVVLRCENLNKNY